MSGKKSISKEFQRGGDDLGKIKRLLSETTENKSQNEQDENLAPYDEILRVIKNLRNRLRDSERIIKDLSIANKNLLTENNDLTEQLENKIKIITIKDEEFENLMNKTKRIYDQIQLEDQSQKESLEIKKKVFCKPYENETELDSISLIKTDDSELHGKKLKTNTFMAEIVILKQDLKDLQEENDELVNKNALIKKEYISQIDVLKSSFEDKNEQTQRALKNANKNFNFLTQDIDHYKKKSKGLALNLQYEKAKTNELELNIQSLQKRVDEDKIVYLDNETLSEDVRRLTLEMSQMKENLKSTNDWSLNVEIELESMQRTHRHSIQDLMDEIESLSDEKELALKYLKTLNSRLLEYQNEILNLELVNYEQCKTIENDTKTIRTMKKEIMSHETHEMNYKEEISALEIELKRTTSLLMQKNSELIELDLKYDHHKQVLRNVINEYSNSLCRARKEKSEINRDNRALERTVDDLINEISFLKVCNSERTQMGENYKEKNIELTKKILELDNKICLMKSERIFLKINDLY